MLEIKSLLDQVKAKIEEAEKIALLKGENFNVFSILNMESAENKTHSAFLCELLNPQGSHGFGAKFSELFVNSLLYSNPKNVLLKAFSPNGATVQPELSIGRIDYEKKTGGRLDIVIKDQKGLNIIIENKIYAGDQEIQIERYCNYQRDNSMVYYLTLEGNEPDKKSSGDKIVDQDFYLISYKSTILNWLSLCQKEAVDSPIVRESIKQYAILLKKLTNQLTTDVMSNEIKSLIKQNLKGAQGIAENFHIVINDIKESFRDEVRCQLEELNINLNHEWRNNIENGNANVFIDTEIPKVKFIIESFSGRGWMKNGLCVGIWIDMNKLDKDVTDKVKEVFKNQGLKDEGWWFGRLPLQFDMANMDCLSNLTDLNYINSKAKEIANSVKNYINERADVINELSQLSI